MQARLQRLVGGLYRDTRKVTAHKGIPNRSRDRYGIDAEPTVPGDTKIFGKRASGRAGKERKRLPDRSSTRSECRRKWLASTCPFNEEITKLTNR